LSELETAVPADLSALAWVVDELRRTLETAHKALRRQQRDTEAAPGDDAIDGTSSAALQQARLQFHQGAGALEIVGQPEAARLLRAAEQAVQRFIQRPRLLDAAAAATIERGSFALLDFLRRHLAGKQVSPLALFPQYRELQRLAGADRIHPADLWGVDAPLSIERAAGAATFGASLAPDATTRGQVESTMLALLRGPLPPAAARMSDLFAGLAAGAQGRLAALWSLAAAFFEAQSKGALGADVYVKRLTSRLLAQLRLAERGQFEISDRLVQDLTFFCSQAGESAQPLPRLDAVRRALGLAIAPPVNYEDESLGRYDPALIPQARRRVESLKETWSAATSGQGGLGPTLREQATLLAESVRRLHPGDDQLARALEAAVNQIADAPGAPLPALAMEVATGLLCLDAALDDADIGTVEFGGRMQQLAERIDAARQGRTPGPIEPWMEELYRRASDRQTMGSVVQELRASLAEIEQQLDKVNRNPNERDLLIPVPAKLSAMRGVLSVLGLDQAGQAVVRMRDEVDAGLAQPRGEEAPARVLSEPAMARLASNVGALGFLIDLLGVQPQLAKTLFRFDAESGRLETVMGRVAPAAPPAAPTAETPPEDRLIEQVQSLAEAAGGSGQSDAELMRSLENLTQQAVASDQRVLAEAAASARTALARAGDAEDAAAVRQELAQAMTEFVAPAPEAAPAPAAVVSPTATAEDDEMLEVFFEEAAEVFETAREGLESLEQDPQHFEALTTVRRAFHTLKGSSRMVGLKDFGEAAWACEQLYNARLADTPVEADEPLRRFSTRVLDELDQWVQALSARAPHAFTSAAIVREATALREGTVVSAAPTAPVAPAPAPVPAEAPAPVAVAPEPAPAPVPAVPSEPAFDATQVLSAMPPGFDATQVLTGSPESFASTQVLTGAVPKSTVPAPLPAPHATIPVAYGTMLARTLASVPPAPAPAPAEAAAPAAEAEVPAAPEFAPPIPDHIADVFKLSLDLDLPPEAAHEDFQATASGAIHDLPADLEPVAPPATPAATVRAGDALDFTLDLSTLDEAPATVGDTVPAELDALPSLSDASSETLPVAEATESAEPFHIDMAVEPEPAPEAAESLAAANEPSPVTGPMHEPALDVALAPESTGEEAANDMPQAADDSDHYKVIGPLRIGLGLFNIFLNEADEQSRRLCTELAEWALELPRPVSDEAVALAHSLAGNSATVGHTELSALSRRLEHALEITRARAPVGAEDARVYGDVAEEIRRLLHQFAAGFLQSPLPAVLERLADIEEREAEPAAPDSAWMPMAAEPEITVPEITVPEIVEPFALEAAPVIEMPEVAELAEPDVPAEPVQPVFDGTPAVEAPAAAEFDAEVPAAVSLPEPGSLGAVRFSVLDDTIAPARGAGDAVSVNARTDLDEGNEFTRDLDAEDAIDPELFEIFSEEAQELLPTLAAHLRGWEDAPEANAEAFGAMRALHTLKGSARLAGAMRLGELAHRLESAFEERVGGRSAAPPSMALLHTGVDALSEEFERLKQRALMPVAAPGVPAITPSPAPIAAIEELPPAVFEPAAERPIEPTVVEAPVAPAVPVAAAPSKAETPAPAAAPADEARAPAAIDWGRFARTGTAPQIARTLDASPSNAATATVRVRAPLLDRLVNQAGEVSITRSRLEADVVQMRTSLKELNENLERLRNQLRDIELQAETQIASRMEQSKSAAAEFDPLEMDRFTRFQELTRMMAESVNDVATVQRSLQQTVQSAEDEMAAQTRLTRALQEDLLRARMVPFDTLSDRLYRVVRQAAKETGVQVRLNVEGSSIELDRSVLDRMAGAFEHLLRNAVVHGIAAPDVRTAQGKDPVGTIDVNLAQQGNEVRIEIRDDGNGLDLDRIEARARATGLLTADAPRPADAELAQYIFTPGFTTAIEVTELAGRGVGMDVVRSDVTGLGGRIETASAAGRGTAFRLLLPLTTAVTRVVQLRCGDLTVAVPASLVEAVRRPPTVDVERAYATGLLHLGEEDVPFFWLGSLLQASTHGTLVGKTTQVVVVRSAEQRVVLHVDQVVGNQEVVVKNLGPQLARLPGLSGMSLLATGEVVPIYNPVALATVYGHRPAATAAGVAPVAPVIQEAVEEVRAPLVLVVDDSLTVRRVTQRLLQREGFRVAVAKDGLDAIEKLEEERPAVMLSDIEMPRMDGFDLLRNVRGDKRWHDLPVIMITSRIAQKHRDLAVELGADHYLGKPYDEQQLIALIQENVARLAAA
jgi:chemosensory pili system protein ChpA (sensor histidine kinase/response regulator)